MIDHRVFAQFTGRELSAANDPRNLRSVHVLRIVVGDPLDDIGWLLSKRNLQRRRVRGGDGFTARLEAIDARVVQRPLIRRKYGTVGKYDLRWGIGTVVLDQRYAEQGLAILRTRTRKGHLTASSGQRR